MFKNRPSFRFALVASALIALTAITATATRSTPFAFIDSVQEFFGMASVTTPTRTVAPMRQLTETTNLLAPAPQPMFFATKSISSVGTAVTENFDSLTTATFNLTDNTSIDGVYAFRAAGNAIPNVFTADNGGSNAGRFNNYGTTSATDRALGSASSGTPGTLNYGIRYVNNTGLTITALQVSYTGEQWRNGGNTTPQVLAFDYQQAATVTSLTAGTFTAVPALNFTSLINTATAAALDGNAAANRTVLTSTITVNIPNGEEVMLRWTDLNDAGNDHGFGIDDLSVTATRVISGNITMNGNNLPIANGSTTPSTSNYTDFGSIMVGTSTSRGLVIGNASSTQVLYLYGSPIVTISGPAASDFSVTLQPTSPVPTGTGGCQINCDPNDAPKAAGDYTIQFLPTAAGTRSATVTIANSDGANNPFTFDIQGTGVAPPPTISLNPSTAHDFGSVNIDNVSATTTSSVTGSDLTGTLTCSASSADFEVSPNGLAGSWASGVGFTPSSGSVSATIHLRFNPGLPGAVSGNVTCSSAGATNAVRDLSATGFSTLTVTRAGTGSGTVTSGDSAINCGATCSANYTSFVSLTHMTATPTGGSTFAGWSGGTCSGTGSCAFQMNANRTVTATFTTPPSVTTTAATSITSSGALLNGTGNPNLAQTNGWFRISATDPGTCNDTFGTRVPASGGTDLGSGSAAVPYSQSATGLTAGVTYYFCAIADSASGTGFGSVLQFTTTATPTTVVSLTRAHPNPTNLNDVIFTVEFAAAVDGVTTSNFALVNGGLTAPSITSVNPQGSAPNTRWNISVNTGTGSGTLGLNLANATGVTPGVSTTLPYVGDVYTIDRDAPAAPVITGTTPSSPNNSSTTPQIVGTAEPDSIVKIVYFAADCSSAILGQGTATGGNFDIGITVNPNSSTTLYAWTSDATGNASPCSGGVTYIHDNIPAVTTIDSTPPASTPSTSASFTFSGSQSLAEGAEVEAPEAVSFTFECQLDSGGYTPCTSPQNYTGLSVAHHIFNVRAIDPAGNADTTPAVYEWDVVAPVCYPAPSGMISWFKGENNGNDYLGNNNALPIGGPTFGAGKVGQAFDFTAGGQTFEAPDSASLDLTNRFTFDAWINPSANHGPGLAGGSVIAKIGGIGGNNGYQFGITNNNSDVFCQFNATGEPWPTNVLTATVPGGIPLNSWTHIACTYDNADLKVYANGALIGTQTIGPKTVANSTSPLRISGDSNANVYFSGKIDEVEIFNRALLDTEIQGIYDAGSLGKCDFTCTQAPGGMVGWYKGQGNADDVFGNNGTLDANATATAAGRVGTAFGLDGNGDRVIVGNPTTFHTQNFTIDGWIKRASTTVLSNDFHPSFPNGTIFAYGQDGYGLAIDQNTNRLLLSKIGDSSVTSGTLPITDTLYHHVAVTKSGNQVIFYVDGVASAPVTYNTTFTFTTNAAIGARGDGDVRNAFFGSIDELEVFNRPLTGAEIAAIYNAGSAGKCDVTCYAPPANMTAWFKGNGNAHEVFGSHGALVGNATATASGMVGQAFGFDGSGDYVTTPDNGKWDLTGDFTIDAWINPVDGVGTERIVSAGNENQGAFNLWTLGYGDNAAWGGGQRLNFAYWAPGYVDINSNAITLSPGRWYHVAFVRSGGTYTYYLDGVAVGSGSMTTAALNGGTTGAIIGARYDQFLGIAEFANGKLDEIEIFNNDLSPSEIQSIYTANFAGKCYAPGSVEFTAANFDDTELNSGSHTATVTVTRTGGSYGTAAVAYTTGDGTATLADDDYELSSGTVTWADGEAGPKNILVTVNGDTNFEGNETINMSFTTVYNAATGPQSTSTVTILNDDANPPTVTATTPADGAASVLRNTSVSVTLSQAMNPATITTQAATGACSGSLQVSSDNFATCIGLGVPAASGGNTVFTATPTALLEGTTTYKIRVTANAQNAGGTPATPYTQATGFTTVGRPNYEVTTTASSITVTDNSNNSDNIEITQTSPGANIRFTETSASVRTFSVNGGPVINDNSDDLPLAGITSVTFNGQGGHDRVDIATSGTGITNMPSLTVNTGTGNDFIVVRGDVTFNSGASVDMDIVNDGTPDPDDQIQFEGGAEMLLSGAGTAVVKMTKYVQMDTGSRIRTIDGDLTVEANQDNLLSGANFVGVSLAGNAVIEATGTGKVTVKGRGGRGNNAASNKGVLLAAAGAMIRGGSGAGIKTDVQGNGGNLGTNTHGVDVEAGATITSLGGDVQVVGFAGGGSTSDNYGVIPVNGGSITSGGNGNVIVQGTGGTNGSGKNVGVIPHQGGTITSGGTGTVTVTGTGGGGPNSYGVQIFRDGRINSGGAGAVSVTGQGTTAGSFGVFVNGTDNNSPGARINGGSGATITVTGTAPAGSIALVLGGGGTNTISSVGNGPINLIADAITLDGTGTNAVNSGIGTTTIRQFTNGRVINLGTASDAGAEVGLSDGELDRVTAGTLAIGDANSGSVNVSGVITQTKTTNILSPLTTTVSSGGDLGIFGTISGPLTVDSGGNVRPGSSPGVISGGSTTLAAGSTYNVELGGTTPGNLATNHDQLNATGTFAAGGTLNVALSGGFVPAFANTFTIATSTGSTSGTFSTVNWPVGYTGTITYNANSIVLSGILAPPTVTSVSPPTGLTTGGESVTVNGTNFTGATSVTFDGLPCAIGAITSTTITCTTPAHAAGPVDVAVTTPGGTATGTGVYTYVKANTALSDLTVVSTALVGNSISVSTTLTRTTAPAGNISGASVLFTLTDPSSGITNHPGTTNGSGVATVLIPMTQRGVHTLVANYAGTADLNSATSNTPSVTVYQRTQLSYSGGSGIVGTPITLTATLTRVPGGAPISGQMVSFDFGGTPATQNATTNASGVASVDVTFPSSGTFSSTTSFSNLAAFYVDASGNQVPTTATANVVVGAETAVAISSGALTINDDNGGVSADAVTLSCNGTNLRINDPGRSLSAGAGTTQVDANTVDVPIASLTSILINTLAGNDTVNLDFSGGCNFIPSGGLTFNGGDPTSGPGDKLNIIGGSATTQTFNFTNEHDGSVVLAGGAVAGTINYTGLEPVSSTVTAANVVLNYSTATEVITVTQDAGAPTQTKADSDVGGESVSFLNPTTSLEINGGDTVGVGTGDDTINVDGFGSSGGGFTANLTINGGTGNDTVNLNTNITFASGNSLDVDLISDNASPGDDTINVGTSASLQLSGAGTATLNASRNITTALSSSLTTAAGDINLSANPAGTTTGAFTGVNISGTVEATGSGKVTVAGKGGNSGFAQYGVIVQGGGVVRGGTGPGVKTEVTGVGSSNGTGSAHGVFVNDFSTITSNGGDVLVTGTGGATGSGAHHYGVIVFGTNGFITSGGTGAVTVNGFGGGGIDNNVGVIPHSGGTITSGGSGAVNVNGTGGPGLFGLGVYVFRSSTITSGGGPVNVTGSSPASDGVFLGTDVGTALISSGGGAVTVDGTGAIGILLNSAGGQCTISSGSNAAVTLIADKMLLDNGVSTSVNAGSGIVNIRQKTNAIGIDLGGADSATALGLTDAELDRITAGTINIGDANTSDIPVTATITRAASTVMNVTSGASVSIQGGQIDSGGGNVTASPGAPAYLFVGNSGVDVTTGAASTFKLASGRTLRIYINSPTPDTGHDQLNVSGGVDITGTNLFFAGGSVATPLAVYRIINNDSNDAITGEFTGYADGAVLTNFLGSSLNAVVDYQGGDGNDMTITMLPAIPEIQFSSATYIEDESQTATVTVTRSGDLTNPSTVSFNAIAAGGATVGATCTPTADYAVIGTALPRTLTFGTNVATQTVQFAVCGDTTIDPGEGLNLSLSGLTNATPGTQMTAVLDFNDTASRFLSTIPHEPIDMTLGSPAVPNPSQIVVAGAPNIIGGMRVTLYDIWHDTPDNIDVLLVGPQNQEYVLMADVGGPFSIGQGAPVTLTFSDIAPAVLGDSATLVTGLYRPTTCETPVLNFAGPAPTGPYVEPGCALARPQNKTLFGTPPTGFGMTNPNGTWRLFVRDDNGSLRPIEAVQTIVGSISGGWGLEFFAPTAADASVSGRVLTGEGRGIRGARVTVTGNSLVNPITVSTGVNGRYTIPGLTPGETYVVTVSARRFFFEAPSRVITLNDNLTDVDFTGSMGANREQYTGDRRQETGDRR
ncbi:MAG: LamG-like jellyroll fold domain-containing protein [Pyrinomonadaceae bacterium]